MLTPQEIAITAALREYRETMAEFPGLSEINREAYLELAFGKVYIQGGTNAIRDVTKSMAVAK